jgi:hypothetical protein
MNAPMLDIVTPSLAERVPEPARNDKEWFCARTF